MFVKNNARFKALFAGLVLLVMAGSLFISCPDGNNTETVDAQQPSITGQPIGGNWNVTTNDTFHLAVTASVTDGGTLSYQWYSNTTNSASGGTAIGTNSKDHHLNKDDYEVGKDYYFYVVVTNTNNNADGNKTATTASSVVKVEVRTTGVTEGNPEEEEWEWDLPAGLNGYFQTPVSYSDWGASYGGWQWTDDGYSIDHAAKTFYYYHDSTMESRWGGAIVHHTPVAGNNPGILIVKVTEVKDSSWGPTQGKYYASAYKDLEAGNKVSFSNASWYDGYSPADGAKNEGVDTLAEAISEYTTTSEYFSMFGNYVLNPVTAVTLENLKGTWRNEGGLEDIDQYITIRGTTFFNFMDDVDDGDSEGYYDPDDEWDTLGLVGNIVDCTITQTSGVLYIKVVINAESVYTTGKYAAVGWKVENNEYQFALGTEVKDDLATIKTTYTSSTSFSGGWYAFEKE
jgi:hypothetical protein